VETCGAEIWFCIFASGKPIGAKGFAFNWGFRSESGRDFLLPRELKTAFPESKIPIDALPILRTSDIKTPNASKTCLLTLAKSPAPNLGFGLLPPIGVGLLAPAFR